MPNPTIGELLQQGLIITVLGITLVFAGLGLLWGLMELLMRVMPARDVAGGEERTAPIEAMAPADVSAQSDAAATATAAPAAAALTAERARVAAIVASMVLAQALPGQMMIAPSAPSYSGDGAGEPWMNTYRGRSLHSWQPPRVTQR